mmetsp:Transcript_10273/g.15449  ORF Transcript_10273/g.15449 Transcript_10273/m.15449 type:complete len:109 (-) Transcript_10273:106-432(-)
MPQGPPSDPSGEGLPSDPSGNPDRGEGPGLDAWDDLFEVLPLPEVGDLGFSVSGPQEDGAALHDTRGTGLQDLINQAMGTSSVDQQAAFGRDIDELGSGLKTRGPGFP